MQHGVRPGDVLADRYLLVDLLTESGGGRFWRAHDRVLARHVALHVVRADDRRAPALLEAARLSATVTDRCLLRVLDAEELDGLSFVVNEWGSGRSLDIILATEGPMSPRRAAWVVRQAASGLAAAHAAGVPHGHLIPENLLIDRTGAVRLIGFAVDAALRGLEPSAPGDVRALAALLYSALTGRWPGPPESQVPDAPHEGVMVLRPRQVRAGIPRALDTLCDEILNPAGTHLGGAYDASRLAAALAEVVGDDTGMAAAEAARHRTAMDTTSTGAWPVPLATAATAVTGAAAGAGPGPGATTEDGVSGTTTTPVDSPTALAATVEPLPAPERVPGPGSPPEPDPEPAARDEVTAALPVAPPPTVDEDDADPSPDDHAGDPATDSAEDAVAEPTAAVAAPSPEETARRSEAQAATEAGMPIFDDEADEVDWLRHHTDDPEPPPPFEDPPERPLFAPGPPDDARTHRGRQEEQSRAGSGTFWPWDTGQGGPGPPPPLLDDEPAEDDGHVPGRRSMTTAIVLIVVIVVAIASLVAYNASRDGSLLGDASDESEQSAPPSGGAGAGDTPEPLPVAGVTDYDPEGDPPEEYPELAGLAIDGDPATAWRTSTYAQQFGPGGLKSGVGLVVELEDFADVSSVEVQVVGDTTLSVYVSDTAPGDLADLEPVAEASGSQAVQLDLDQPDTGRFVVVWIDQLPAVSDGFRAEIAEITVLG